MKKRFTVYIEESDWKNIQDSAYWKKLSIGEYLNRLYKNELMKGVKKAQPEKFESHKPYLSESAKSMNESLTSGPKKVIKTIEDVPKWVGGYSKDMQVGKKGGK